MICSLQCNKFFFTYFELLFLAATFTWFEFLTHTLSILIIKKLINKQTNKKNEIELCGPHRFQDHPRSGEGLLGVRVGLVLLAPCDRGIDLGG